MNFCDIFRSKLQNFWLKHFLYFEPYPGNFVVRVRNFLKFVKIKTLKGEIRIFLGINFGQPESANRGEKGNFSTMPKGKLV